MISLFAQCKNLYSGQVALLSLTCCICKYLEMKGILSLSVALYACLTAASSGTEVFKRLEKALESRSEAKSNVHQDFHSFAKRRLEKRSSYYLNSATQRKILRGTMSDFPLTNFQNLL